MSKLLRLIPLGIFVLLGVLLWRGLSNDPHHIPSPRINKMIPDFSAVNLLYPEQQLTQTMFKGHVSVLNVFASWCLYCLQEHGVIADIAKLPNVTLYGLNYKDNPVDAKQWLQQYGNPFQAIIADTDGSIAIDFGVYGTPETFFIDPQGILRYKYVGPISQDTWRKTLYPILQQLTDEAMMHEDSQ